MKMSESADVYIIVVQKSCWLVQEPLCICILLRAVWGDPSYVYQFVRICHGSASLVSVMFVIWDNQYVVSCEISVKGFAECVFLIYFFILKKNDGRKLFKLSARD